MSPMGSCVTYTLAYCHQHGQRVSCSPRASPSLGGEAGDRSPLLPAHKIAAIEAELAAGKGIRRIARLGRWRGHGASGLVA